MLDFRHNNTQRARSTFFEALGDGIGLIIVLEDGLACTIAGSRVALLISGWLRSARDTVEGETASLCARSLIVMTAMDAFSS